MDEKKLKEAKSKLNEINGIVATLDPAIRAQAFEKLAPLYFEGKDESPVKGKAGSHAKGNPGSTEPTTDDQGEFFRQYDPESPADSVYHIAAWFYSQYGVDGFTNADIKGVANAEGVTIPSRPDMTLVGAQHEGKNLFRKKGKGWQPTVHGEAYLKENYGVKRGRDKRPDENAK